MWKVNTKGLIDVKLETKSENPLIRRAGCYDVARWMECVGLQTKQQHSATIYLILVITSEICESRI